MISFITRFPIELTELTLDSYLEKEKRCKCRLIPSCSEPFDISLIKGFIISA